MKKQFSEEFLKELFSEISEANAEIRKYYPGDSPERQPVQTVYGGAQLFKSGSIKKIGELALQSMNEYGSDPEIFTDALGIKGDSSYKSSIHNKVIKKLESEAVEDFRIDFEDGFGIRPDSEEDETAMFTSGEVAKSMSEKTLSPFIGIRVKTLSDEMMRRALRTLDIFITNLTEKSNGILPDNFVVTLPKVTHIKHVSAFVKALKLLEKKNGLTEGSLKMEIMVETTQSVFDHKGNANLMSLIRESEGRCIAAHFGVYDYTALCDITARYQNMQHPVCDFARQIMKVTLAGTGIWLSDGATNIMPVPVHRGNDLTEDQKQGNRESIYRAWKISFEDIKHSLQSGFYQGWDLHPAQIPVRYAAVYDFFLEGLQQASERLINFIDKAAQATLVGDVFDDAATGQGLLNYFLRAYNCGAVTKEEITRTGLTEEDLRSRSFLKITENRQKRSKN
ncbi:MAG: phosphoenolpyruvate kinase [Bacteroidetes bacterium]|nr:phosphoenolpyruvate kinase [Bacteroidota bacterium]